MCESAFPVAPVGVCVGDGSSAAQVTALEKATACGSNAGVGISSAGRRLRKKHDNNGGLQCMRTPILEFVRGKMTLQSEYSRIPGSFNQAAVLTVGFTKSIRNLRAARLLT
jgi:hypothetical protein